MKYRFLDCCLDTDRYVFQRGGEDVHLEPQVFELLSCLVRSAGELITRETLLSEVWKGLHVSDAAIDARINAARRAVGDDGRSQRVIVTVARRGFRFAPSATVEEAEGQPDRPPAPRATRLPILAVLLFRYHTADPLDILAEGILDDIVLALSNVGEFRVIAHHRAISLRDCGAICEIAAALSADYLVEGSIRRLGDQVRVAVNLVDAQGCTIWSSRFDETLGNILKVQDSIAMRIAGQLPVWLREAEILRADQADEARACVLRALPYFWQHDREANDQAIRLLSRALTAEADDIRALSYLAWALAQRPVYLWSHDPAADRAKALHLANRAAARAGSDPPALVAISAAFSLTMTDPLPALAFAKRAVAIDPSNAWGRMRLGWALNYCGRPAAALPEFDHALRLSPRDPFLYNFRIGAAIAHVGLGNFDRAIAIVDEVIASTPQLSWAYRILASIYRQTGDAAREAHFTAKLIEANPGLTMKQLEDAVPPSMKGQSPIYIPWQLLAEDLYRPAS
ncbi:DNA-binding winged helix-turn-helix (wHTH) domain-containing protein [Paracoccus aminovorans]|uniref:DNA-binding winged helix-turn-helix (WHTH) domain-containing protein n=1 Tax=Paracoccus aminovorans TaxID=34004 RepID=A0A1I3F0H4_9RHOB|nr:winged helix-turn-helix domain-containing protein [Paracoccus aminovorans]CQR84918.1 adenylate cyclase [Paracoccus aminovorans]SFI04683.1 DNA-binding winged helix-turn-helix (wHTH) domain-containing protein [Paracoccus aminovorans]